MKRIFSLALALFMTLAVLSVQPAPAQTSGSVAALEAYKAVLQNKMTFYSTDDRKTYNLHEFDYWSEQSNIPLQVVSFAVVDMDDDGIPEVVLELTSGFDGSFEVLHYEDGRVYGFNHSYRGMVGLTSDGIYEGSSGAADSGFYKACITKDTYEEEALGYSASGADGTVSYYIGKAKVSKSQYDDFLEKMWAHARANQAAWHDFTDAAIASVFQ